MNTVWQDLDSMFKHTLRKYVANNNRLLFDVYAKAVGFNPHHVGLLYLTLKLEEDQLITNNSNSNKKRSYTEMYDSDSESKLTQNNQYHEISVYQNNQITIKNGTKNNSQIRSVKRRKILSNKQYNNNDNEPHIHSVTCRRLNDNKSSNTKTKKTKTKVILSSKIPSPLPIYNIYNNRKIIQNYENLAKRRSDNNTNHGLNDYEKLKALSNQFRNKKLDVSVVQSNKKKIGQLLAHCDEYKASLVRKQASTYRKGTATVTR